MGKVSDQLFLGSKTEEEIALSSDPDYETWTEKLDEQFRKEFGNDTGGSAIQAESTKEPAKQIRKLQLSELRGHSRGGEAPPF